MFSTVANSLLVALLMLLPTAASAKDDPKGKSSEDRVVVRVGDGDDIETIGDDDDHGPVVVRVGRGAFLGVRLIGITDELRAHYGAPRDAGILVGEVEANSPAARAGIEVGDVITSVDGERVTETWDISRQIHRKKAGEAVDVEIIRGRSPRKVSVTLDERRQRERTIDLGELGDRMGRHTWLWKDGELKMPRFKVENLEELPNLQQRLDDLEKRLRELEKKVR